MDCFIRLAYPPGIFSRFTCTLVPHFPVMNGLFKFIFFAVVGGLGFYAGIFVYRLLNKKIKDAATGQAAFGYSLLLILACAALFIACVCLLVYGYAWLTL